ncbi:MAG: hypothetical protein Unbinned838contig1000_14 [Prokaryotic dsDNA virus sp.]|nr:MAG: hypothetical protein Unbinned838contig1000_14 [Prokaryotic dsDNA virus sp.]
MKTFLYICRMFKNKKSKYYWDVTRNMTYEQAQEYLKKGKIKRMFNKLKTIV